jgi:hypothetical protein
MIEWKKWALFAVDEVFTVSGPQNNTTFSNAILKLNKGRAYTGKIDNF